ncbi:MAG: ATP-binding cassette domain-containing protein [Nocardioidaceae bacterium]
MADGRHPRDLSEGQKLSLVLAIQLTAGPRVLLLDEPTRGLDYAAKTALAGIIGTLRQQRARRSSWPPTTSSSSRP